MSRDSSFSMAKGTNLCQKLICDLKSHVHVFRTHLINSNFPLMFLKGLTSSKLSFNVSKRFNQLKAYKTMNIQPCSKEKHF